jgi:hypothetical protein
MPKNISILIFTTFTMLFITLTSAQEKKTVVPPGPVMNSYQELMFWWNDIGGRVIAMAEDFPEDKYNFKAQKDQRTFGDNLLHVAANYYLVLDEKVVV